jgi:hypothetical protein
MAVMFLTPLSWLAVAGAVVVAFAMRAVMRRRRATDDLGLISQHWIAQHRATSHDPER